MKSLVLPRTRLPKADLGRPRWRPALRQGVEIKPEFEIGIDLGNLPMALGLFGGSAVSFLAASQLPASISPIFTLGGVGLAVGGVISLLARKEAVPPVEPGAPTYTVPEEDDFAQISGRIISPGDFEEVPTGTFSDAFSVVALVSNESPRDAVVQLQLRIRETPHYFPTGFEGDPIIWVEPRLVNLPAGMTRQLTWDTALRSISLWSDVDVTLEKIRAPGQPPIPLASRVITVR